MIDFSRYICQHKTKVFDKERNIFVYYPCGICDVCRQKKSAYVAKKVDSQLKISTYCYLITLSYHDDFLPLAKFVYDKDSNMYHIKTCCDRFVTPSGETDVTLMSLPVSLSTIEMYDKLLSFRSPYANYDELSIPILNYYDVKCFFKRFRKLLDTLYKPTKSDKKENPEGAQRLQEIRDACKFSYFVCSEYGGRYKRPHYHVLLFANTPLVMQAFESANSSSPFTISDKDVYNSLWPFGSTNIQPIEDSKGAASYVSGYVSLSDSNDDFYSLSPIRPRARHSKNFGKEFLYNFADNLQDFANLSPSDFVEHSELFKGKNVKLSEVFEVVTELYRPIPHRDSLSDDVLSSIIRFCQHNSYHGFREFLTYTCPCFTSSLEKDLVKRLPHFSSTVFPWIFENRSEMMYQSLFYRFRSVAKCVSRYHSSFANFLYKYDEVYNLINYNRLVDFLNYCSVSAQLNSVYPWSFYFTINNNDIYSSQSLTLARQSMKIQRDRKIHNDKVIHF